MASKTKPKTKKRLRSFHLPRPFRLKIGRLPLVLLALILTTLSIISALILKELPSPTRLSGQSYPASTIITDRHGTTLYEIYADKNRTPVKLDSLPPYVSQAAIAIEDQTFYRHFGFSIQGITRAIKNNLSSNSLQGGSTITQQLVKVTLLTPDRTLQRKAKEAALTIATEILYSKNDILEMYLNHIPYGGTAWGIEAAAKTYFNKSAQDLTLAEAALLAGLPAAPTRFSPLGAHPELAIARQQEVLRRMVEDGYISSEEAEAAKQQELHFATGTIQINAPHFVLYVKDLLTQKYGQQVVERGGLKVTTTLDLAIQEQAQASVSAEIEELDRYRVGNGAAVITNPKTGEILAMVGSKNYFDSDADGQVNVTLAHRQPGSSIKPLNYATAFELKKATPGTMLLDVPTCFSIPGQPEYCPKNYDGAFHGPVQLRYALGNSYNIPAVKVLALNGLEPFIATASAMGISTFKDPQNYGPSLTLGGGEVTMLDMATAFGVLANEGIKVPLQPLLKVTDYSGNVLEEYSTDKIVSAVSQMNSDPNYDSTGSTLQVELENSSITLTRALHRAPAYLTSHILADNDARQAAFGSRSELVIPNQYVSVKTGTTNNLRDNWTIGYTPEILTVVWVGNNDNTPMNPYLVSGVTGAAPIWNDIMTFLLADREPVIPERPDSVVSRPICRVSGLVSHPDSPCQTRNELFWEGTEPGTFDSTSQEVWVKKDSGIQPDEGDTNDLELRRQTVLSDPFTPYYCLDCARPKDEQGKDIQKVNRIPANLPTSTPPPNQSSPPSN